MSKEKQFKKLSHNPLDRYKGIVIAIIAVLILWTIVAPSFFSIQNFSNLMRTSTVNMLITMGLAYCLIIGGIDLTVGSVAALSGVATAILIQSGVVWYLAVVIGILVGLLVGVVNGLIITYTSIPPFIATIAMQFIVRGLAFSVGSGSSIMVSDQGLFTFGNGYTFGIPNPVIVLLVVTLILTVILTRTPFGQEMYAVGNNETSAHFAGVNINKVKIIAYTISGTLAGLAGVILTARMMSGQPVVGQGYEGDAVAAAVLGGVSISGGQGNIIGALLGAVIIGILTNGLNIWGINSYWQSIIKGTIILAAVIMDVVSKWKKEKELTLAAKESLNRRVS